MAIALFYAVGTGIAVASPSIFGALIATHSRTNVFYGYIIGASLMIAAGLIAAFLAVPAERRFLPAQPSGRGPASSTGSPTVHDRPMPTLAPHVPCEDEWSAQARPRLLRLRSPMSLAISVITTYGPSY